MTGMTTIDPAAAAAREDARKGNGEFGRQERSAPETALIVNGTSGEQRLEELQHQFDAIFQAHSAERRKLSYAFPGCAADFVSWVAPDVESMRFEFIRLDGREAAEARVTEMTVAGETKTVNWDGDADELDGEERDRRLLADAMFQSTSHFVQYDDDLDITGFSYDDVDDVRVFDLNIADNATGGTLTEALDRNSRMTGTMMGAAEEYQKKRHDLLSELPATMQQLFDEWAPGTQSVHIRWDTSWVSEESPNDYRPRAVVAGLKMKDGTTRELEGDANEYQDRATYRAEAAAGWVNELLSYAIEDKDDIAAIAVRQRHADEGDSKFAIHL